MKIKHPKINQGDIVVYDGEFHEVIKVWNHGFRQWWLDLRCTNTILPDVDFHKEHMSVPSYDVETIDHININQIENEN